MKWLKWFRRPYTQVMGEVEIVSSGLGLGSAEEARMAEQLVQRTEALLAKLEEAGMGGESDDRRG
jgi:hypothetical protein